MSAYPRVHHEPVEVVLTQELWAQFNRDYRAEVAFAAILQEDFYAATETVYESGFQPTEVRAMIRCFGSLIDGLTGTMRNIAISTCNLFGQPLNPFLREKVEERGLNGYNRIYTSYRLIGEFLPRSPLAAMADSMWDDLHAAIELRNRIAHPRNAADLDVPEVSAILVADVGNEFSSHLNKFVQWLLQKEQRLIWEHVTQRRRLYPKIGRNERCPCGSHRKYKNCCAAAIAA